VAGTAAPGAAQQWRAQSAERLRALSARRPRRPHRPGRVRAGRVAVALTLSLLAGLLGWFLVSLFQPFKGEGGQQIRVSVPRGASLDQIAELLERRGIVSSSFFFQARARLAGRSGDLKPGSYKLREGMSYSAALDALEKGTPPNIVVLTIPEGRSRREVARLVDGQLEGSYLKATRSSPALNPRRYRAENARNLEGFLFPATYELKKDRPMSALVEQQLSAFRQHFEQVDLRYARKKNLTPYDVLIIASLVEREAVLPKERPLIASVIYNRLKQDMPLGIDATVRFVTGNWNKPLRNSELANPSPYNTRLNPGLPPGPIGNPGIDSIRAAARPARTDYLFFVVKPGGDGAHAFASSDAEHQRNVERYNQARERLGRSPD
jgi:peptidoglycan lytic transglycosylase G